MIFFLQGRKHRYHEMIAESGVVLLIAPANTSRVRAEQASVYPAWASQNLLPHTSSGDQNMRLCQYSPGHLRINKII